MRCNIPGITIGDGECNKSFGTKVPSKFGFGIGVRITWYHCKSSMSPGKSHNHPLLPQYEVSISNFTWYAVPAACIVSRSSPPIGLLPRPYFVTQLDIVLSPVSSPVESQVGYLPHCLVRFRRAIAP